LPKQYNTFKPYKKDMFLSEAMFHRRVEEKTELQEEDKSDQEE